MVNTTITATNNTKIDTDQLKAVLSIIAKYHENTVRNATLNDLNVLCTDPQVKEICNDLNLEIISPKKLTTESFVDDEIQEYLPLIIEDNNFVARLRLASLLRPLFYKSWSSHKNVNPQETKEDVYWEYMAECTLILDEYIDYYWGLKQSGAFTAKDGYDKPVDFTYILKLKLNNAARTLAKESSSITYGDGITKKVAATAKFLEKYAYEHNGQMPTNREIADHLKIKDEAVVNGYLEALNLTVVSGDSVVNNDSSDDANTTIFDTIEDSSNGDYVDTHRDEIVAGEVDKLDEIKSKIIKLKFGIGCDEMSDISIRRALNIKKRKYEELLSSAMSELSVMLADYKCDYAM